MNWIEFRNKYSNTYFILKNKWINLNYNFISLSFSTVTGNLPYHSLQNNTVYTKEYTKLEIIVTNIYWTLICVSFNPNSKLQYMNYYHLLFIEGKTEAELIQDYLAIWQQSWDSSHSSPIPIDTTSSETDFSGGRSQSRYLHPNLVKVNLELCIGCEDYNRKGHLAETKG